MSQLKIIGKLRYVRISIIVIKGKNILDMLRFNY